MLRGSPSSEYQLHQSSLYLAGPEPQSHLDLPDLTPPKKRQKHSNGSQQAPGVQSSKNAKRRRAKLEMMPDLNLDVLFHILGFLRPADLLSLARTSKPFRQLLMRRSSAFIWRSARAQIEGFPDCPPDLSEPAYANLAFDPHCYDCGKVVLTIVWVFRVRYCARCGRRNTISVGLADRLGVCLPNISSDTFPDSDNIRLSLFFTPLLHRPDYTALKDVLAGMSDSEKEAYRQERSELTSAIIKHARLCDVWQASAARARRDELENLRSSRKDAIVAWLTVQPEFQPEIDYFGLGRVINHAIIREPKPMTERTWIRVRDVLRGHLHSLRMLRLEETVYTHRRKVLVQAYSRYLQHPAPRGAACGILPHVATVASFPEIDEIIKLPADVTVDAAMFNATFIKLPELAAEWQRSVESQLAKLCATPDGGSSSKGTSARQQLKLATSVFFLNPWQGCMVYPDVLAHECFIKLVPKPRRSSLEHPIYSVMNGVPWRLKGASGESVVKVANDAAAAIVLACGLDPRHATIDDMERLDARLACELCSRSGPRRAQKVMTWKAANCHAAQIHSREKTKWCLVNGKRDRETIKALEADALESKHHMSSGGYCCELCQPSVGDSMPWRPMRSHLMDIHDVPSRDAKKGINCYLDPNHAASIPDSVTLTVTNGES
ncbi:hypothetical protein BV22DRAFT_1093666 [Leucogyrophana mollusca]|uniref:Uncharacterized protein n=1 Tax=Leucogyrophana mollusca TaxID=85980 RepID=A0ACB8BBB7_9AGAM|nr:hypothetical protein BV22DRAFT_1093666 [Leucogyrophana mollusca]